MRAGALGFATEDQLKQFFPTRPDMPQRLMSMNAGQVTEPIKDNIAGRWYIFKVNLKVEQPRNLTLNDVRANIINAITQQRQGVLLNALVLTAVSDAGVKNHLAERIVQNPQAIVEMRPSHVAATGSTRSSPAAAAEVRESESVSAHRFQQQPRFIVECKHRLGFKQPGQSQC